MTDFKTNIFQSKKLRSALMVLALFSGSVLGGMMFAYITKPKEACAQCVAIPSPITCDWSGDKWVNGDGGCDDDILFTCTSGIVTNMARRC